MKKLLITVVFLGAVSFATAQEKKNVYVKEGNLIKATFAQVSIPSVVLLSRNVQAKHKIHSPISAIQSY